MVDVNGKADSVNLTDALHAGFDAAMERVKVLNLDPCATLIDQISKEEWASWDASNENALVIDQDKLDDSDDDYVDHQLAA
ncbi:hypothetical protein CN126_14485 [Sinorhizobium meliloti]|uniref:hypothetical protein n=1 Tax=Rhizobium meliloti TaxID=382 RepID=UPI000FD88812|nr:hypothetical protein [Sinorhizobium meliloti]RVK59164.1 hypothetical protein CN162_07700 [Sinorhizobium meliloti]RVM76220.1 hypothetical protein CN126_14485 [Sinorhizobium meliloti]RVM95316.1 hypothetical protein CN122_06525 [Sinorhizobium meliloti]RVN74718.1 hypothetical protein CN110_09140 [Sinorhizobium meliloti]